MPRPPHSWHSSLSWRCRLSTVRLRVISTRPSGEKSYTVVLAWSRTSDFSSVRSTWRRCSARSEEHTSELQSLMRISYAVLCLKKKHPPSRTQISEDQTYELTSRLRNSN